jgi:hypothetical protein
MAGAMADDVALTGDKEGGGPVLPHHGSDRSVLPCELLQIHDHIPTAAPSPRGSEAPISTARWGSRMIS